MEQVQICMEQSGIPLFWESFSALDRYFGVKDPGPVHILTDSSLIALAKAFDDLQYPGLPYADAALDRDGRRIVFRCVDSIDRSPSHPFTAQNLIYSVDRDAFLDYRGVYADLRRSHLVEAGEVIPHWVAVMDAAGLVSRYHYEGSLDVGGLGSHDYLPAPDVQRELLLSLFANQYTEKGLALLYKSGFVERFWPELYEMGKADHAKEYHPEGNVWQHSLETLKYRKRRNPILSAACLLHDVGKPVAEKLKDKPFKDHAEISSRISSSFLRYLGFPIQFIRDVCFLVRYHMVPGALKKLPLFRIEKLLDNPLFPLLLELYRADVSSTYRSPEGYYEACRIYKTYRRKRANPYVKLRRDEPVN